MADFNTAVGEDENSKAAAEAAGEVAAASAADGPKTAGVAAAEAAEEAAAASVADGPKTAGGAAAEAASAAAAAAAAKMVVSGDTRRRNDGSSCAVGFHECLSGHVGFVSRRRMPKRPDHDRPGSAACITQLLAYARVTRIPRWKEAEMADLATLPPT